MRRLSILILTIALWLVLAPDTASAAGTAENLTGRCSVEMASGRADTFPMLDQNHITRFVSKDSPELILTCDAPIGHLYVIWDQPPGKWSVSGEGNSLSLGTYGFIHEYIKLDAPSASLKVTLPQEEFTLCDIIAFGEGEIPDWVERWEPPLEQADLLVLPAHAGDEFLFFGGTLPYYAAERGFGVQVAYLTNHLAESYRPHELLGGLWEVGVRAYPVMSGFSDMYADSLEQAENLYGREEFTGYIAELLRRFKPQVVIGHDPGGEYGHGVHMLGASCLLDAARSSSDASAYPESAAAYGVWDVPKVYLHLYPENEVVMDWDMPLSSLGMTAYDAACMGYSYHTSQLGYFKMEHWGDYDCRRFGLAYTSVGPDAAKNDFLENTALAPAPEPEPQPEPEEPSQVPEPPAPEPSEQKPALSYMRVTLMVVLAALMVSVLASAVMRRRYK